MPSYWSQREFLCGIAQPETYKLNLDSLVVVQQDLVLQILVQWVPATQTGLYSGSWRAYRRQFPQASPQQPWWEQQLQETSDCSTLRIGVSITKPIYNRNMELVRSFGALSHSWGIPESLSKLCSVIHVALACNFSSFVLKVPVEGNNEC